MKKKSDELEGSTYPTDVAESAMKNLHRIASTKIMPKVDKILKESGEGAPFSDLVSMHLKAKATILKNSTLYGVAEDSLAALVVKTLSSSPDDIYKYLGGIRKKMRKELTRVYDALLVTGEYGEKDHKYLFEKIEDDVSFYISSVAQALKEAIEKRDE